VLGGFPLSGARIREIAAGKIRPMRFDYAGLD
jgi:hypothetical protein